MKKLFIALGIAFALIVGMIIGEVAMSKAIASEPEPESVVSLEEAAFNYATKHNPYEKVNNVVVHDIVKDDNYGGGYYVEIEITFDNDPGDWWTCVAVSSLGDFTF